MILVENDFFKILCQSFGEYQTNCYLALDKQTKESLIIDPGIGANTWAIEELKDTKPLAILNTHGHFDHVWSNAELTSYFEKIALLCPLEDAFMLIQDCFSTGQPSSTPTILVGGTQNDTIIPRTSNISNLGRQNYYEFGHFMIEFSCYPGHTPGCSTIVLNHKLANRDSKSTPNSESQTTTIPLSEHKLMFSGDFIFHRSIGRSDFPYSSSEAMRASLKKFMEIQENMLVLPGHGDKTSVAQEQKNIPYWLTRI
ncbi:MBL fold metallo-hydrolase [uncultured Helicobacter sp.]|uniref:MBL fold metallo-hydrolase n=1 Tax=uncultured Helicobacter sp. TaxID=175537 RepID=UPI002607CE10|nr:MBL fold metallo-hydrolase [uncultured Helicobacter sp.]